MFIASESPPSTGIVCSWPLRQSAARAVWPASTTMPVTVWLSVEMLVAPAPKPKSGSVVSVRITPS